MSDPGNEFFLSCYLTPPGADSVLSPRHDQSIALWRRSATDVQLCRLWELERVSGQKHHFWPLFTRRRAEALLRALLAEEGLALSDLSAVWGTPSLPGESELAIPAGAAPYAVHSLAHLFGGLLSDTGIFKRESIVGMATDDGPDFVLDTTTKRYSYVGCVARRGSLLFAPVESPAPLYSAASRLFVQEAGTLMALATACPTRIDVAAPAALGDLTFFGGPTHHIPAATRFVRSLVNEAEARLPRSAQDPRFTLEENVQSAVMSVVQECCELVARRNIERLCDLARLNPRDAYLSTSGGFALNCPTNSRLMDDFGFRGLLTPPCANDGGQALGLGLLGLYGLGVFEHADLRLGSAYHGSTPGDLDSALEQFAPWIEVVAEFTPQQFVADVCQAPVAWVDGPAEVGPRSLGHRSLLGDPRAEATKLVLNAWKGRQWWRPVAPVVMAELAHEWFACPRPSPYMLEVAQVLDRARALVPAIVHLDGTARHQTLTRPVNARLYGALEAFLERTGVPMLCNTSLNDRGEPIVNTAAEALNFCVRKGVRAAYLSGHRVGFRDDAVTGARPPDGPHPRQRRYFTRQEADRDAIWNSWLDRGYSPLGMFALSSSPELRRADPRKETPERVNRLAQALAAGDAEWTRSAELHEERYGPGSSFREDVPLLSTPWQD